MQLGGYPECRAVARRSVLALHRHATRDQPGIGPGDWIVTEAGSRYLVATARLVRRPRWPRPGRRWQMTVHRLPKHCALPADVRAVELRWYRR
ncbi:MAG: hypothetical protein DLM61_12720 [Pseudonocardiales bacterium]|nr:MAG: hypothetical protein DLM61_12720 [Pseudonocardiales bacterium]